MRVMQLLLSNPQQLAYHICSLILFPSSSMVLILKSIPEEKGEREREEREERNESIQPCFCICWQHSGEVLSIS